MLFEEGLPHRVELHVGPVIVEEVELDSSSVRPVEIMQIYIPVVGADKLRLGVAVHIDELHSVGLQECFKRLLGLGRPAFPVGATQPIPDRSEADFIRVGVLDDQPFQPTQDAW